MRKFLLDLLMRGKTADDLTENLVDAVLTIKREGEALDLHMVEIMEVPKPVLPSL